MQSLGPTCEERCWACWLVRELWGDPEGVTGAEVPRGGRDDARLAEEGAEVLGPVAACSARAASMSASKEGTRRSGSSAAWRRHCTAALTKQVVLSAQQGSGLRLQAG